MAIKRPTPSQLRAVAHDLGMTFTDDDLRSYLDLMAPSFGAYDAVEAMPDYLPEVKYPRTPGYQPEGAENPYNAWYVKTTVKGASSGKLAGKTVVLRRRLRRGDGSSPSARDLPRSWRRRREHSSSKPRVFCSGRRADCGVGAPEGGQGGFGRRERGREE